MLDNSKGEKNMSRTFELPDLGEGIHEAEIQEVLVSVGDEVEEDQPILVVETDKASVEIPSPYAGTVEEIHVEPGDWVEVGDTMMSFSGEVEAAPEPKEEPEPEKEEKAKEEKEAKPAKEREGPVPASPATRRLARELEVDLTQVPGTGPGGRVTAEDVRDFAERAPEEEREEKEEGEPERAPARAPGEVSPFRPSAVPVPELPDFTRWGGIERVPLRSVRRATARQMARSWSQIPHVNHTDQVDITELEHLRRKLKDEVEAQGGQLTLTVFAMKAAVAALKAYPRFNASFDPDAEEIILKRYYNIGVAVDTDRGLIVPVIRDIDRKSITELAVELTELAQRTRDGEATLEDLQGGTFTITNIGVLGGTTFAPIINYPEVAILGMARARWQPVVRGGEEGAIETRYILPLIVAFDHRVADGADAARFAQVMIDTLEDPDKLLLRM
jgi:pyruvate dehydrogenase E2 component (dihydrolipoamide acetyltransferase)